MNLEDVGVAVRNAVDAAIRSESGKQNPQDIAGVIDMLTSAIGSDRIAVLVLVTPK